MKNYDIPNLLHPPDQPRQPARSERTLDVILRSAIRSMLLALIVGFLRVLFHFIRALNASFPAESINIAKVRLERPLSNETALARAWIFLLGAFLPPFLLH